jgi:hypothetical protein
VTLQENESRSDLQKKYGNLAAIKKDILMLGNFSEYSHDTTITLRASTSFSRAYRRAKWRTFKATVWKHSAELLHLREANYLVKSATKELREIPLHQIVGSVGRQHDFTRGFLPLHRGLEERWTNIWQLVNGLEGVPPIEAYEVSGQYFVLDGHHRVSVAKQLGMTSIEGYVTRLKKIAS